MFIPNAFRFDEIEAKIEFMKRYSFATIITCIDGQPEATQLPFSNNANDEKLILSGHFATGNPQAKYIEENTSLVIFSEPHAYISPKLYEKHESVPTWNYIAVHAYAKARVIESVAAKEQELKKLIATYEKAYLAQWDSLPEKYKTGMMRGIIAFELEVTELQGKKKLSQNRSATERERIIAHLEQSGNKQERELAAYTKQG